jgi:hypothetical protein
VEEPRPTMAVEPCEIKVYLIYNLGTLIVVKCTLQMADFYYYHKANDINENPKIQSLSFHYVMCPLNLFNLKRGQTLKINDNKLLKRKYYVLHSKEICLIRLLFLMFC